MADNLKAENAYGSYYIDFNQNNQSINFNGRNLRFVAPDEAETVYFLWEAVSSGNWQRGGLLDDVKLVEIGNAAYVTYVVGEDAEGPAASLFVEGETFTISGAPTATRKGYTLQGWYLDEAYTLPAEYPLPVTESTTLYAKWEEKGQSGDFMEGWDGNGRGASSDRPDMFGWQATPSVEWSTAITGVTYANAYRDDMNVNGSLTRVLLIPHSQAIFSYPVRNLKQGKIYRLTADLAYINHNYSQYFSMNSQRDGNGEEYGSTTASAQWSSVASAKLYFEVPKDMEEVYMLWQVKQSSETDRAITWNYSLVEDKNAHRVVFKDGETVLARQYFADGESYTAVAPTAPEKEGYDFIGWYADPEFKTGFNFGSPVTDDTVIYARYLEEGATGELSDLTIAENTTLPALALVNAKVVGDAKVHLTGARPFIGGSKIDLAGSANLLYVERVRPNDILNDYKDVITVAGQALNPEHDRVAIYANGSLIIPGGWDITPMTIYTEPNLQGESKECFQDIFYRGILSDNDLGTSEELGEKFDNKIRSFRLAHGYMAVLANHPDGTGFSRCYIANDGDLVVNELPEGLEFASFVKVSRWQWVSKKGGANLDRNLTDITWYYDWNIGGESTNPNFEYAAIRQNLGWPGWNDIASKPNVSHCSGLNEPDHTDQSNATEKEAIAQWHEMFRTGMRLGSPTPDSFNKGWLNTFMEYAERLNYRVDYVVYHMYWANRSGSNLKSDIESNSARFGHRPLWITEWNNGANWTNETWPTESGPQMDADFNKILDDNGNEKTVNRPHSPENSAKQVAWLKDVLPALDDAPYLERHAWYDWVQDARALVLGGKLTPAGKVFRDHQAALAYRSDHEYVHTWKIAPAWLEKDFSDDFKSYVISWYDHNGETGKSYTLERKDNNVDESWHTVATFEAGKDYDNTRGVTITFTDPIQYDKQTYRIKALSYKDTESEYSYEIVFDRDAAPAAPSVTAKAVSTSIIELTWNAVSGARGYMIERALTPKDADSEPAYEVIVENTAETLFRDEELEAGTSYTYRVTTLSTAAATNSATVVCDTKDLTAPAAAEDIFAASGDAKVTITWEFEYDVNYYIYRADAEEGEYAEVGDVEGANRYVDATVENGKTYYYKVQPYNSIGKAEMSAAYKATPGEGQHLLIRFNADNTVKDEWGGYHASLVGEPKAIEGRNTSEMGVQLGENNSHIVLPAGVVSELDGDFTIATWIKIGNNARIFDFNNGTGTFMMFQPTSNTGMRYKITCAEGTFDYTFPHEAFEREAWNHIVLVSEGDNMSLYINDELASTTEGTDAEGTLVAPAAMGVTSTNYLGRSAWASDAYGKHAFDDFAIYSKALDENQIHELFANNKYLSEMDIIGGNANGGVTVRVDGHDVIVTVPTARPINVVSADGRVIRTIKAEAGHNTISGLGAGFYIIEGCKAIVK
ncbi:MAG: glycosyl hydrolase [Lachnospiraceae bacterium]|nr:glycosyl hydrolase [Lachnospiraceae bacterium]